jgi:hypothetical protein
MQNHPGGDGPETQNPSLIIRNQSSNQIPRSVGTLAPAAGAAYTLAAVKQPFISAEEEIDRIVGRRAGTPDSLRAGMQLQETAAQLHIAFKHRWWPKGVYRFKTHEDADAWMTKMLARSDLPRI